MTVDSYCSFHSLQDHGEAQKWDLKHYKKFSQGTYEFCATQMHFLFDFVFVKRPMWCCQILFWILPELFKFFLLVLPVELCMASQYWGQSEFSNIFTQPQQDVMNKLLLWTTSISSMDDIQYLGILCLDFPLLDYILSYIANYYLYLPKVLYRNQPI